MPFDYPIDQARINYPEFTFISALTPSAQKAAFHVQRNGEDFCLKIIAPDYGIVRLEREIIALENLSHPNIVRFVEHFNSTVAGQGRHYILEEYVDGTDLAAHLGSPWSRDRVSNVFSSLCDGLSEIGNHNIVHRDLKPSNIRIRTSGEPVIVDFGVARLLDMTSLTDTPQGASIGTPPYFAPEQFIGNKHDIDHRTALFTLGVILHQAVTGNHPFFQAGMTNSQLQDAVCTSETYKIGPPFVALPGQWQQIINKLLAKSRIDRPYNARQVGRILRSLVSV